jgi:hypothetical protein
MSDTSKKTSKKTKKNSKSQQPKDLGHWQQLLFEGNIIFLRDLMISKKFN